MLGQRFQHVRQGPAQPPEVKGKVYRSTPEFRYRMILAAAALAFVVAANASGAETVITIKDLESGDLKSAPFTVTRDADLQVRAIGAERKSSEAMFAYAWILDVQTRRVVWSLDEEFTSAVKGSELLREFSDELRFKAGTYEVYFFAGDPYFGGYIGDQKVRDLLDALGAWLDKGSAKGEASWRSGVSEEVNKRLMVSIQGDAAVLRRIDKPAGPRPIISLLSPGNDAYLSAGFSLPREMDLEIYALGEYSFGDEQLVDRGWIINAATRERVWDMTRHNTDWAGGAEKNRRARERLRFPSGNYVAYYVTDDSHTLGQWNANPPFDPGAWGLQIFAVNESDAAVIVGYEDAYDTSPLIRLTRVGDNALVTKAFRVESPARLRVYAIGEYDRFSDRMADYGWITRADRSEKIWIMKGDNSEPAGGAAKNRQAEAIIELDPGEYVAYYTTDGSHSYAGGWNSSPPYDQQSYGLSLFPAESGAKVRVIAIDNTRLRAPDALAAVLDVRNHEERSASFSLTSPTRVRIHAVGEGTRSGMADYGWIEDSRTGHIVWEMTYRKTEHAGGASKNRMVNQTILLDKGEYILHYVTDDSHAFGSWNAAAPDDPTFWGITVTAIDRAGN